MKQILNLSKFGLNSLAGFFFRGSMGLICCFCLLGNGANGQTPVEEIPDFNEPKKEPVKTEQLATSTFFDQFLFGMVTLEAGTARLLNANGEELFPRIPAGTMIKVGYVIETPKDETAEIKLGCGSAIRLAPETRVKILPYALDLQAGSCLSRHVGQFFPMKIQGAATILISKDSVVSIERTGDTTIAEVHIGMLRTPGMKAPVIAGQSIEASGRNAAFLKHPPEPRVWNPPSYESPADVARPVDPAPISQNLAEVLSGNENPEPTPPTEVLPDPPESGEPELRPESDASFFGKDD